MKEPTGFNEAPKTSTAELFNPPTDNWEEIGRAILEIEELCMGANKFKPADLQEYIENPDNITVLLKEGGKIIGFSLAMPDKGPNEGDMYICATEVHPDRQGRGRVGILISELEEEARRRGFKFLTRNARMANGYADSIAKHYKDRIVKTHEETKDEALPGIGPRRFFKIAL